MRYLKMLGVAAFAGAVFMAFVGVGTASATTLDCEGVHCPVGTTFDLSLKGTTILETTGGTTLVTCTGSTIHGTTTTTGSASETVKAVVDSKTEAGCTKHTTALVKGELEFHHIAGTHQATITTKNTQTTVAGLFNNESCIYGAGAGINFGTVSSGTPATLSVNVLLPRQAGSGPFCPAETRLMATYVFTIPKSVTVTAG